MTTTQWTERSATITHSDHSEYRRGDRIPLHLAHGVSGTRGITFKASTREVLWEAPRDDDSPPRSARVIDEHPTEHIGKAW